MYYQVKVTYLLIPHVEGPPGERVRKFKIYTIGEESSIITAHQMLAKSEGFTATPTHITMTLEEN